jgi:hypothetical protein
MFPMSLLLAPLRVPLLGLFLYVCMYVCKSAVCFWNKVVDRQNGDPSDWLVLAIAIYMCVKMLNCPSVSTGIAAHVGSSLYVGRPIPEIALLFTCLMPHHLLCPGGLDGSMYDISLIPWP